MNGKDFKDSWDKTIKENNFMKMLLVLSIVSNCVLGVCLFKKGSIVTLVPPELSEKVKVAANTADEAYFKTWGLYLSSLAGNVSPKNADVVIDYILQLVDPEIYDQVRDVLLDQVANIKINDISIAFEPRQTTFEPQTNKIFVLGQTKITGPFGKPIKEQRTFEFTLKMEKYRPLIIDMKTYKGAPHLTKKQQKQEK